MDSRYVYDGALLRKNARKILKKTYAAGFVVNLVTVLAEWSVPVLSIGALVGSLYGVDYTIDLHAKLADAIFLVGFFGSFLLIPVTLVFITAPVWQGAAKYQFCAREDDVNIGYIGYAFHNSFVKSVVCTVLLVLHIFLSGFIAWLPMALKDYFVMQTGIAELRYIAWLSLPLAVLPIRTAIRYMFVPMVLANDESISCSRAFFLSDQITKGYKLNIFGTMLYLFILRAAADVLLLCVGGLFVMPYIRAVYAEMYAFLEAAAEAAGIIARDEEKVLEDDSGTAVYEFAGVQSIAENRSNVRRLRDHMMRVPLWMIPFFLMDAIPLTGDIIRYITIADPLPDEAFELEMSIFWGGLSVIGMILCVIAVVQGGYSAVSRCRRSGKLDLAALEYAQTDKFSFLPRYDGSDEHRHIGRKNIITDHFIFDMRKSNIIPLDEVTIVTVEPTHSIVRFHTVLFRRVRQEVISVTTVDGRKSMVYALPSKGGVFSRKAKISESNVADMELILDELQKRLPDDCVDRSRVDCFRESLDERRLGRYKAPDYRDYN